MEAIWGGKGDFTLIVSGGSVLCGMHSVEYYNIRNGRDDSSFPGRWKAGSETQGRAGHDPVPRTNMIMN